MSFVSRASYSSQRTEGYFRVIDRTILNLYAKEGYDELCNIIGSSLDDRYVAYRKDYEKSLNLDSVMDLKWIIHMHVITETY